MATKNYILQVCIVKIMILLILKSCLYIIVVWCTFDVHCGLMYIIVVCEIISFNYFFVTEISLIGVQGSENHFLRNNSRIMTDRLIVQFDCPPAQGVTPGAQVEGEEDWDKVLS